MDEESGSGLAESSALGPSQDYSQVWPGTEVSFESSTREGPTSKPTGLWIGLSSF